MNRPITTSSMLYRIAVLFFVSILPFGISAQVRGEYFWNNDPGIGKAAKMQLKTTDGSFEVFDLDATAMTTGVNMLGIRVFDHGRWSHTAYHLLVKQSEHTQSWTGEYFWDEDPGIGKATPFDPGKAGNDGMLDVSMLCDGLAAGQHTLGIRVFSGKSWSQTTLATIFVPSGKQTNIIAAEYFWDEDPGIGKATSIDLDKVENGDAIDITMMCDGLAAGQHTLGLRVFSGESWSQTTLATVTVSSGKQTNIIAAEYFWGEDPGFGKGTPIDVTPGKEVNIDSLAVDFPTVVADSYILSFRARSESGWGTTTTKVIPHLYVENIELTLPSDTLNVGTTAQIAATITPADAFDATLAWSSSEPAVATVDDKGLLTALAPGTTTITATSADREQTVAGSIEITVVRQVETLRLSENQLTMSVSDRHRLKATVLPADATNPQLEWSVSGDAVEVDQEGLVTAVCRGNAVVVARTCDGSALADSCTVKVGYLMGDADDSGSLAVNDVVLTARGVVDDYDEKLVFEAVDMNGDTQLTVGDLSLVVDAVINWQPDYDAPDLQRRLPGTELVRLSVQGNSALVSVANSELFTGIQFDVACTGRVAARRVELAGDIAHSHRLAQKRFATTGSEWLRAMAYGTEAIEAMENVVARVVLDGKPGAGDNMTLSNILLSDRNGNLYSTRDVSIELYGTTGVGSTDGNGLEVKVERHKVTVVSPEKRAAMLTNMNGVQTVLNLEPGENIFTIEASGVYLIDNIKFVIH